MVSSEPSSPLSNLESMLFDDDEKEEEAFFKSPLVDLFPWLGLGLGPAPVDADDKPISRDPQITSLEAEQGWNVLKKFRDARKRWTKILSKKFPQNNTSNSSDWNDDELRGTIFPQYYNTPFEDYITKNKICWAQNKTLVAIGILTELRLIATMPRQQVETAFSKYMTKAEDADDPESESREEDQEPHRVVLLRHSNNNRLVGRCVVLHYLSSRTQTDFVVVSQKHLVMQLAILHATGARLLKQEGREEFHEVVISPELVDLVYKTSATPGKNRVAELQQHGVLLGWDNCRLSSKGTRAYTSAGTSVTGIKKAGSADQQKPPPKRSKK